VLTKYHWPSQLTHTPDLQPRELAGLIMFLRSL
jgi:hypothetical protein